MIQSDEKPSEVELHNHSSHHTERNGLRNSQSSTEMPSHSMESSPVVPGGGRRTTVGGPGGGTYIGSVSGPNSYKSIPNQGGSSSALSVADLKLNKIQRIIHEDEIADLNQLRTLSWDGLPAGVRPQVWRLLLGYLPVVKAKRQDVISRKRREYAHLVAQYYDRRADNDETWRQIHIDIPRMQPLLSIFQQELVQEMFERILYVWAIRHPASGYVQGMNDLVTPFFVTFLSEFTTDGSHELAAVERLNLTTALDDEQRLIVEADTFWGFSKLLDSIQNNYTTDQPGIQKLVALLARIIARVDTKLHSHLDVNNVQYLQFAFRWMNNLLIRELPLRCIIRLWDTYLAEGGGGGSTGGGGSGGSSLPSSPPGLGAASVVTSSIGIPSNIILATGSPSSAQSSSNAPSLSHTGLSTSSSLDDSLQAGSTPFSFSFHLYVCAAFLRWWSKQLLAEKDFQGLMLALQNLPTYHWSDKEIRLLLADAYQLKYIFTPNHLKQ